MPIHSSTTSRTRASPRVASTRSGNTGVALAMVAAKVGTTRLIDNVELTFPEPDLGDGEAAPSDVG